MASLSSIIADISHLSVSGKNKLRKYLVSTVPLTVSIGDFVSSERFSDGFICPYCGEKHVVRYGRRSDDTQRFKCKACGKIFVSTSNSIASGTRKSLAVWEKYVDCMMLGLSVRESADRCGIHRNTAFAWRHKILGALQNMAEKRSILLRYSLSQYITVYFRDIAIKPVLSFAA